MRLSGYVFMKKRMKRIRFVMLLFGLSGQSNMGLRRSDLQHAA